MPSPTRFHRTALILALGLVTACGDKPAAPAADAGAAAAAPVVEAPSAAAPAAEPAAPEFIHFEPTSLSSCGTGDAVLVRWDASSFAGVVAVKVLVLDEAGKEVLFATAGTSDQKETGTWARAGSEFVLRNNDNDQELARAKIPGAPCAN